MWKCPKCGRTFKNENQSHYCCKAPETVGEYILAQDEAIRGHLESVRNVLRASLPDAVEKISEGLWNSVQEGMRLVVTDDLDKDKMLNGIKVEVAGKTGTAQERDDDPSHALFVSYAPYQSPEVSVTTVIQYGYASANAAEVTGFIYAYMYDKEKLTDSALSGQGILSD